MHEAIASVDESASDDLHDVKTKFMSALAALLKVNSFTINSPNRTCKFNPIATWMAWRGPLPHRRRPGSPRGAPSRGPVAWGSVA